MPRFVRSGSGGSGGFRKSVGSRVAGVLSAAQGVVAEPAPARGIEAEIVVTAPRTAGPLEVVTDPGQPRQPLPAHDGADYPETIPASP